MSQKPIDNLTLERLAAGALGENETLELMERLRSEDGGMERLQALLQENDEFFEKYPARVVLPQILDQHMREQRRASQGEQNMSTLTIMKGAGLAFGVAGLVGMGIYLSAQPSPEFDAIAVAPDAPFQKVADNLVPTTGGQESVAGSPNSAPTKQDQPSQVQPSQEQPERPEFLPLLELDEMILIEGEERRFGAKGVSRVSVELSALVGTRASEDRTSLIFTGLKAGITGMQVHTKGGVEALYVRVAHPYDEAFQTQMQEDLAPSFEECAQSMELMGELDARVVVDRRGQVLRVQWDHNSTGSDELRECVREAIEVREFPAMDPPEVSIARLKFSR